MKVKINWKNPSKCCIRCSSPRSGKVVPATMDVHLGNLLPRAVFMVAQNISPSNRRSPVRFRLVESTFGCIAHKWNPQSTRHLASRAVSKRLREILSYSCFVGMSKVLLSKAQVCPVNSHYGTLPAIWAPATQRSWLPEVSSCEDWWNCLTLSRLQISRVSSQTGTMCVCVCAELIPSLSKDKS